MSEKLAIRSLQLVNEHRTAYGLRYNDFGKYRKHCANRAHRLRSNLKMTHGKGREFKKLPSITSKNVKEEHLELLITEAERAWAYSQDLDAQSLLPANEAIAKALRHKATGRLRRAVNWANRFLELCQELYKDDRFSAPDLVQATIFVLILNGRFLKHRDNYQDTLTQLCIARELLDHLAAQASTSREQALATLFSDEISVEIRYCAYQLGWKNATEVEKIVQEISQQHRNSFVANFDELIARLPDQSKTGGRRETLDPLFWEGERVPIRVPELVVSLLHVQNEESIRLSKLGEGNTKLQHKSGVAAFDAVLSALTDAEEVARKLLETQKSISFTSNPSGTRQDIRFIHGYIVYQMLSKRCQRDLLLVSTLLTESQSADNDARVYPAIVKVLDTVIQGLDHMQYTSVVEESPVISSAIEARISLVKSRKCLYLHHIYAANSQFGEALTLVQLGSLHLREARAVLDLELESNPPKELIFYPLQSGIILEIEKELFVAGLERKKSWFALNGGSIDSKKGTFQKPVFFDIALNYVQLDMKSINSRAGVTSSTTSGEERPVEVKQMLRTKASDSNADTNVNTTIPATTSGGLTTLLGGWWGRK